MGPIRQSAAIVIEDPTQVAVARRAALEAARRLDFSEEVISDCEIVAVELANNILQHAGPASTAQGRIYIGSTVDGSAVQIIAIDKGHGIANIRSAMQNGFTTAATPGLGLGSVQRLAAECDIYSSRGKGSVVSAIITPTSHEIHGSKPAPAATAVISTPLPGERVNGDSWSVASAGGRTLILMVDGLGHGLYASEAAALAVSLFDRIVGERPEIPLAALIEQMHGPMRATRGAAVLVVAIDPTRRQIECCGVGNISCALQAPDGRSQSIVSHNGTVGHQMRRIQPFTYVYMTQSLLIMHSDGLAAHWKFAEYADLIRHTPATVAGVLYRDAWRGRDDATILVSRLV